MVAIAMRPESGAAQFRRTVATDESFE